MTAVSISAQAISIAVSAVTGAITLLLIQRWYRRVRLLHGIHREVLENHRAVNKAGTEVYQHKDPNRLKDQPYSADIYEVVKKDAPLLYMKIAESSRLTDSYFEIEHMSGLSGMESVSNDVNNTLRYLERLERDLNLLEESIEEVKQNTTMYRVYAKLFLDKVQVGNYVALEGGGDGITEIEWRPSKRENTADS